MIKTYHLAVFLFICFQFGLSQELPPVQSFYPETYNGGDQNWSITQDEDKIIYFANNKGLLSFNGSKWELNPTPNQSIMRSVLAVGDRIYSGQYRDFGYWERNRFGELVYNSLLSKFDIEPLEDEEFWGIEAIGDWVMFQSLDRIYVTNETTLRSNIIDSETTLTEMILVDDTIIFQKIDQGIFKVENGEQRLITDDASVLSEVIVDAYKKNGSWYFLTQNSGIFISTDGVVSRANGLINQEIEGKSIYSGRHLNNDYYALGSISNGLLLFNDQDECQYQINQSNGLSNNTVLAVFEDIDGNIWLAMDNGLSVINQNSRFKVYYDQEGILGTVYSAIEFQGDLYLGTNQGLFYKNKDETFSMVKGTEGQVWSLDIINGELFCGHDRGTFLISNSREARKISNVQGTWNVKSIPDSPNLLMQGNYNGLYILSKNDGQWALRNKIEGFDTSTRYFEFMSPNQIVVSHEYKGIYYLEFDSSFDRITDIKKDDINESVNSSLVFYQEKILYATEGGIYSFNEVKRKFQIDSLLSQLSNYSSYVSGKLLTTDNDEKLWYTSAEGLSYAKPDNLTGDFTFNTLALPLGKRATKSGYEHILQISDDNYLLGTTEGYIIIDLSKKEIEWPTVNIDKVLSSNVGEPPSLIEFSSQEPHKHKTNSFQFSFYAPYYQILSNPKFRYRLKGYYDEWSNWTYESQANFNNLPAGNYEFEVQSKIGDFVSDTTANYAFKISRPWYLSIQAILIYAALLILSGFGTHSIYRSYYRRQRKRLIIAKEKEIEFKELEAQQQIMQFRNENLQLDIENKNRELGLSTMNLIQKNELLNDIKIQLSNVNSVAEIKQVVRLINRNLNTSADWKVFEEAFNNADKDFLRNIKIKHPSLTSNDLRLCAYLRLNLSSKEIAPLLNISHKSVEVKRYRLRKKMELPRQINLTDYILGI